MFVVFLRFAGEAAVDAAARKRRAAPLMAGHNAWLARGFDEGVFLLAGSLDGGTGGAVVAHGASRAELQARVEQDPFVAERLVDAEIVEISPARADARLEFLRP